VRILIAAGGTGGHLLPGVAVAREMRTRGHRVHFVVRADKTSQAFLSREGFASSAFHFSGFPRSVSPVILFYPFSAAAAWLSARRVLKRERPDVVLGMGGYISVPVGLAAAYGKIPLVLHEQNARAGLANRFLSRWARAVGVTFEPTEGLNPRCPVVRTGLPLRPDLVPRDPAEARRSIELDPDNMTVLVFGGSQGARALNRLVTRSLPVLESMKGRWQFIHLTGEAEFASVKASYRTHGWRAFVRSFWPDMATLYSAADFVVARSGANTVMELARMGRRAIVVPYPHATDDHQAVNARYLEAQGLAHVIREEDLTETAFQKILRELPPKEVLREEAARRAGTFLSSADAPAKLAELVEKMATPPQDEPKKS